MKKKKAKQAFHEIDNVQDWYKEYSPTEYQIPYMTGISFKALIKALEERDRQAISNLLRCLDTMPRERIMRETLARKLHELKVSGKTEQEIIMFGKDMETFIYTSYGVECAMEVANEIN